MSNQIHGRTDRRTVPSVVATAPGRALTRAVESPHEDALACRIRGEYLEMPGLNLTLTQAQRMWNLRLEECERLLDDLVDAGFLERTSIGTFVLAGTGAAGA